MGGGAIVCMMVGQFLRMRLPAAGEHESGDGEPEQNSWG